MLTYDEPLSNYAFSFNLRSYGSVQARVGSEYSSKGLMWGQIGGTAGILVTFVLLAAISFTGLSANWLFGVGAAFSGVWWLVGSWFAFAKLPERRGPPLPAGVNVMWLGWVGPGVAHIAHHVILQIVYPRF